MTARELFDSLKLIESVAELKKRELNKLKENLSSFSQSEVPVHVAYTKAQEHKFWDVQAEIAQLENEVLIAEKNVAEARKNTLQHVLMLQSVNYREVLYFRYMDGLSWSKIAKKMNYSKQNAYKLHSEALKELDQLLRVE